MATQSAPLSMGCKQLLHMSGYVQTPQSRHKLEIKSPVQVNSQRICGNFRQEANRMDVLRSQPVDISRTGNITGQYQTSGVHVTKHQVKAPARDTISTTAPRVANVSGVDAVDNGGHALYPMMRSEFNRLQSFTNWQHGFVKPQELACEGFFSVQKEDIVRCAFCGVELSKWQPGDVPSNEHRLWSERCPIVLKITTDNIPLEPESYDTCGRYNINMRTTSHPDQEANSLPQYAIKAGQPSMPKYASYEARLRSFEEWPVSIAQRPQQLAEAGFFYTGKSDQTVCFSCGGGLKSWEPADEPWEQHAMWFSRCPFLRYQKSPEFIDRFAGKTAEALRNFSATQQQQPKPPASPPAQTPVQAVQVAAAAVQPPPAAVAPPAVEAAVPTEPAVQTKDQTLCKICYSKEVGVVFLPCGHMVACVDCAPVLTKCAVCRRELEATVRAFLS